MSKGKTVAIEIELLDRISGGLDRVNKKMDALKGYTDEAKKGLSGLENMSERVKKSLVGLGMAFSMKGLVSEVANVRGQFQQLEVAFNTMLGSAEKADALMGQLVRTAAITPFDLEGVAQGAKQLLAYGMEAENVNETLTRLGDIAAGLSMPLNDLVYLYGTTMAQGRLYTQDLNQFTGRGIPMIQELAKVFGVAENKVKDLVEAGKVGFPEVQKVIENLTGEGSKFGGLMEEQSKTITGQISNIEDAIATMFNDIGKQSEGVINTTLSGVSYMVEHYEQFGRVLMGLVTVYGTYRTACMTVAAVQSMITAGIGSMTAAEAIHYGWIVMVEKAQKLLNATMLSNPYVLVATAIAGVVAMMISMKTDTELILAADEAYEAQKQKVIEAEEEHKRKMEELCSIADDEALSTDTRREALNRLEQKYPSIFVKYDTEYEKLKNIKKIKLEIAELEAGQSITKPKNELANVNKRIQELEAKQKTERWKMSYGSLHRVGGLSRDEEAELKSLQQRQQNLNKQVRKDSVNAYFENLTGVSNNDLKKQIKERENLIARMNMSGHKYGYTTNDGSNIRGTYTKDELQYQLNKLKAEQNRRNEPRKSSSDWGAADKKAYEAALKEYNDFIIKGSNNLTKEEYDKKAKELKEKMELAKKEYDSHKPGTDKDSEKAQKNTAKAEAARAKEEAAEEHRKQVKEKVGQELAELQRKNDEEEINIMQEGLEKKLRQIENDYQAQKNEINKQETAWKRDNKKAGIVTETNGLTKEQTDAINEANALNEKNRTKAIEDANKEALKDELLAMTDYLKEYGTIQEQKYAIAKEYDEKIAQAQGENQKKLLDAQKKAALDSLDANNYAMGIDWSASFQGIGNVLKDIASETLSKLDAYMKSDDYKKLDANNKKAYADLRKELREQQNKSSSPFKTSTWNEIEALTEKYKESVKTLIKANQEHTAAVAELQAAEKEYEAATTDAAKKIASAKVAEAQGKVKSTADALNNAQDSKEDAQQNLTDKTNDAAQGLDNFGKIISDITSGTLSGFVNGVLGIINSLKGGTKEVGSVLGQLGGKIGGLIGAIVQIIDALGEDPAGFIDSLLSRIIDAIDGILNQLFNGKLAEVIIKDVAQLIGKVAKDVFYELPADAIKISSFGAIDFTGWFNGNEERVKEAINNLTESNENLQKAIDNLKDVMSQTYGKESTYAYEEAKRRQEEYNQNTLKIAEEQMGYHSAHHSWGYYWDERGGFNDQELALIREKVKGDFGGGLWDFLQLSPEDMQKLLSYQEIRDVIKNTGEGPYGKTVLEKLDDYAALAGKIDELTDDWRESITQISFDSMKDNFVSNLMDMSKSAEDFSDDFAEMMQKALLSYSMEDLINGDLKKLYSDWAELMDKKNGQFTDADAEDFNRRYDAIVAEGIKRRDNFAQITGYTGDSSTSQNGKSGGFSAMTQDQGSKLEGMFTSGLQHWSSMDDQLENVVEKMNVAEGHLARISENTGMSVTHLNDIKEEMRKIVRDGLKMK